MKNRPYPIPCFIALLCQTILALFVSQLSAQTMALDTCDRSGNDSLFWNGQYWLHPTTQSHDLCEMEADLSLTLPDTCLKGDLRIQYLLFLDLDGNDSVETVVNSANVPPAGAVYFGNSKNPNFTGGTGRQFDQRPVADPLLNHYRFALEIAPASTGLKASVRFNTQNNPNTYVLPQIPHGRHRIRWIVTDSCQGIRTFEQSFRVNDCEKPVLVCKKDLTVNLSFSYLITLWAQDFLASATDNCTPKEQLALSVSSGTPVVERFPIDLVTGRPVPYITFTCDSLAWHNELIPVRVWAKDLAGNTSFCEITLRLTDLFGDCRLKLFVSGAAKTPSGQGVEEVTLDLMGTHRAFPIGNWTKFSDANGNFFFSYALPYYASYELTPTKNDNPLNGVTTLDLAKISRHILGTELLDNPYKIIAADVNRSGTVTSFDVVELRKLILGIYDSLPNNTAWRFVPQNFVFPDPTNPFAVPFPEKITEKDIITDARNNNFVAIKIGDVNGSATPGKSNPNEYD